MRLTPKARDAADLFAVVLASPFFFPSNFYYRIGSLIFVNGLAVTGIVILTGYAGQISLGQAGFAGIGAYACALAPAPARVAFWSGRPFSALWSPGVLAWAVGRPILRLRGYYLAEPGQPRREHSSTKWCLPTRPG